MGSPPGPVAGGAPRVWRASPHIAYVTPSRLATRTLGSSPHLAHAAAVGQWGEGRVEAVGAGQDEREGSERGLSSCIVLRPYLYGIIDGRLYGAAVRSTHGSMVSRGWGRTVAAEADLRSPSGRPTHPDSALYGGKGEQQRLKPDPRTFRRSEAASDGLC